MLEETKTLRLGARAMTLVGPLPDDEYWCGLEDGSNDAFWQVCQRYVRPTDICFDIGANLGVTSLLLAQVEGEPKIHSFEPGPRNFAALCSNLEANGAGNVTPVQAAVGVEAGRASFLEASAYGHLTASGSVEVEVLTLPGYLISRGLARLDFCKIDIEGSEWQVLRSAMPVFQRDSTLVYFEFNSWSQMAYGSTNPKEFLDWICATFPAVYALEGSRWIPVTAPLRFLQKNLFHHGCVDDLLICTNPERIGRPGETLQLA